MFEYISKLENKNKIAIVVVGYNRIKSISRLLNSLLNAKYPSNNIPLVISIDCSGDEELYSYVRAFEWPFGEKYVNIQKERLGLKNHIYQCGNLTKYFKAIILLEDDLFVSPYFYTYVEQAVEAYGEDSLIAEISLYKNESNGYAGLPFYNVQNGHDVFLMQDVSTWGECWTENMWNRFVEWRNNNCSEELVQKIDMPSQIKGWSRAWSKYYNAYVVQNNLYCLYPNAALTTNFSDAGEHGGDNNSIVQVNLQQCEFEYRMPKSELLTKYDIYFSNEDVYKWLGLSSKELSIDLYCNHRETNKRYLLSTNKLQYHIVKSFALYMRPIELNIKYNIQGNGIYLYDTEINELCKQDIIPTSLIAYYHNTFSIRLLFKSVITYYKKALKRKLKL